MDKPEGKERMEHEINPAAIIISQMAEKLISDENKHDHGWIVAEMFVWSIPVPIIRQVFDYLAETGKLAETDLTLAIMMGIANGNQLGLDLKNEFPVLSHGNPEYLAQTKQQILSLFGKTSMFTETIG